MEIFHGTVLATARKIEREGFLAGSFFSPQSGHAGYYALRTVKRLSGGDPVVIRCEVPDDLVEQSPDVNSPHEVWVTTALPASVVLGFGPDAHYLRVQAKTAELRAVMGKLAAAPARPSWQAAIEAEAAAQAATRRRLGFG